MSENIERYDHLVVVCSFHGEKYLGWIPERQLHPQTYLKDCMKTGEAVELENVRILVSQVQVEQSPDGKRILSIGNLMVLMPMDMFSKPMSRHYTKVSSFYFPSDNAKCEKSIKDLLNGAERMETNRSAAEAGIEIPTIHTRRK